jgi:hypothetical protein
MIRRDRSTSSGGGIIVYIKKSILVKSIIIDEFFETISFIFQLTNKFQISVIACYRPESKFYSELDFFNHLLSKLKKLEKMSDDVFIVGDLNNNILVNSDNSLINFCSVNGCVNTITKGTRINPTTKFSTLLDVILCKCNQFFIRSDVFHMPCSDHAVIISVFDHSVVQNKPSNINSRCFNDKKILSLKQIVLSVLSISNFDRFSDVNSRWCAIKALINSCINIAAPLKNMHVKTKNLVSRFDKDLVNLSKKRNRLCNNYITSY